MTYLTLTEAAEYASRVKGFAVDTSELLRAGIHGGLRIAAPFDSLMRNLTAHANEDYLGLLFLNPADGDLFRIESQGQATIKKAYGLDGVSIYAPFVVQTLAQLRVMVSDLDKFLPLLESLDTPQAAPAQQAEPVPVVVPERKTKAKRRTWWDVASPYIVGVLKAGQYATAKDLFQALEAKAGPDSPFDKGTGNHRGSLFVRDFSTMSLKTLSNKLPELREAAKK